MHNLRVYGIENIRYYSTTDYHRFSNSDRSSKPHKRQSWLNTYQCQGCDLNHAQVVDAYLSGVELSHANLRGTNLFKANLASAVLEKVNLQNGILTYEKLRNAIVTDSGLQKAKLQEAEFAGSNFKKAIMPDGTLIGK